MHAATSPPALSRRTRWTLLALVFCTGAVIMGVEIVGIRIISRNLSSSNYVFGSVIGVFMAALAVGYYAGGRLADWRQSTALLGALLLIGGCFVMAIPQLENAWGPLFQRLDTPPQEFQPASLSPLPPMEDEGQATASWDVRVTSLLMSIALFFVPSVCLGATTPFVSRLEITDVGQSGGTIGGIFAVSTFGSIAGTLLTSFYLMEALGVRATLLAGGGILCLWGLIAIGMSRRASA